MKKSKGKFPKRDHKRVTITKLEYVELLKAQEGVESLQEAKVVCPMCSTAQSAEDMVKAGADPETVMDYWGFSCIGRFDESQGCNWTLGGLFQIHEMDVIDGDGETFKRMVPENYIFEDEPETV